MRRVDLESYEDTRQYFEATDANDANQRIAQPTLGSLDREVGMKYLDEIETVAVVKCLWVL